MGGKEDSFFKSLKKLAIYKISKKFLYLLKNDILWEIQKLLS